MSLLTETSPRLKMPGKRLFEEFDYQSQKTPTPPFKRSNVSIMRKFPSNCGPFASNRGEKAPDFISDEDVIEAKPLKVFEPPNVKFEYMKPNIMERDEEEIDPPVEFVKVNSQNEASKDLEDLKASSQPLKFASKHPLPKIRKGVTISRDFPLNCGEEHVSLSRRAKDNTKRTSEKEQCDMVVESSDEPVEDDNEDCVIIEKFNGVCIENVVQEPYRCDFDWKEDETDDDHTDISILTPSEWNKLQSGFNSHNVRTKDMEEESLVEEMEKHCEEYGLETFDEPNADTTIGSCNQELDPKEIQCLCIVPYNADNAIVTRDKVQEVVKLFEKLYNKLLQDHKAESKEGKVTKPIHFAAAKVLRTQQKWLNRQPIFGHVPGVEVGDEFQFRAQLAMVGLHHQFISGINFVTVRGKKFANSVVDSGRYENKVLSRDVIIYSGQGGNPKVQSINREKSKDQKLKGANLALKNSKEAGLPVRVIRKTYQGDRQMFIYEGLYLVRNFWQERNSTDKMAFMFEMERISGQPDGIDKEPRTLSIGCLEQNKSAAADDVSQGKEKFPIHIVNDINNDEKPQPFTYITKMKYPDWYSISEPEGCDCIDGCTDSKPCYCAYKNGGEIPFNEEGFIMKARRVVHECGPSCKCPPSCQNRVSQHGPRFQLEVFKTKSMGWGVRSREDIKPGSFICEYIGEVLHDKEAEQRKNDEYLFDLDKKGDCLAIDAAQYGNVGRFINHSCSPNLYAQNVVYDNEDKNLPHIMLFASKKIPAMQELSYHYNYKIDRVLDANGNIKKKQCHCGSRKCTGRMY
ncbi:hypothetical protein M9H77_10677 [Catharanthus roseus]|uniref:Uncharacterized protein n=1 Tax=Catharanthus roseus TaxID=4058 RepID=A0ACC0BCM6_CATRO|nr:hypothetical protein M9H77_10677 [Catharanthus roseus]